MTRGRIAAFVEDLLRNRRPRLFAATADEVAALRATIELRAAQPGASFPRSEFVAGLHHRLSEELTDPGAGEVGVGGRRVSRRTLLTGVTGDAAAAILGGVVDHELGTSPGRPEAAAAEKELVADPGTWTPVAASSEAAAGKVVRFATTGAVGFVSRSGEQLRAVSGACSHQGCLLALDQEAGRLDCPCHGASFAPSGEVLSSKLPQPLPPLPRLPVRERGGRVEVYLPPGS